jgi:uncharacterized protein (DUF488 family)
VDDSAVDNPWITHNRLLSRTGTVPYLDNLSINFLSGQPVMNMPPKQVFTIGHSTHPTDLFLMLLKSHRIEALADVRSFPASRRHPQFNRAALERSLDNAGVTYHHMVPLGGRREGFAYSDYAKTEIFQEALGKLEELAESRKTVVMCAEALPENCHRRFIAEALKADGFAVTHILSPKHDSERRRSPILPGL